MRRAALVLACVTLVWPRAFGAASTDLARARTLYRAMEYEKALIAAERALASPETTTADRVELHLTVGLCRFQLGNERDAVSAFREALAIDPAAILPRFTSPKIARAFEAERARLATAPAAAASAPTEPAPAPEGDVPSAPPAQVPASVVGRSTTLPDAPAPAGPTAPEPSVERRTPLWLPIAALGVAAAAAGAGVFFGATAQSGADASARSPWAGEAAQLGENARRDALVANVLFGAAGIVGAAGVVVLVAF